MKFVATRLQLLICGVGVFCVNVCMAVVVGSVVILRDPFIAPMILLPQQAEMYLAFIWSLHLCKAFWNKLVVSLISSTLLCKRSEPALIVERLHLWFHALICLAIFGPIETSLWFVDKIYSNINSLYVISWKMVYYYFA